MRACRSIYSSNPDGAPPNQKSSIGVICPVSIVTSQKTNVEFNDWETGTLHTNARETRPRMQRKIRFSLNARIELEKRVLHDFCLVFMILFTDIIIDKLYVGYRESSFVQRQVCC